MVRPGERIARRRRRLRPAKTRRASSSSSDRSPSRGKPSRTRAPPASATETTLTASSGRRCPTTSSSRRSTMAWQSPKHFAPGDAELDLLSSALATGKASRLYKALVYDQKIAQSVEAEQESRALGSRFVVGAIVRPGVIARPARGGRSTRSSRRIRKTADDGRGARARAEPRTRSASSSACRASAQRASLLNMYQAELSDPGFAQQDLDRYRTATTQAMPRHRAEGTSSPNARVILARRAGGQEGRREVKRSAAPALVAIAFASRVRRPLIAACGGGGAASAGAARRPVASADAGTPAPDPLGPRPEAGDARAVHCRRSRSSSQRPERHERLAPRAPRPARRLVQVVVPAGAAQRSRREGRARVPTANMLDEGAGKRGALDLSRDVDDLGARLGTGANADSSFVSLTVLAKQPRARVRDLRRRREHAAARAPPSSSGSRTSGRTSSRARQSEPDAVAGVVVARRCSPAGHPYAHPSDGTLASAAKVTLDDVKKFYAERWRPDHATLVVVGDVTRPSSTRSSIKRSGPGRHRRRRRPS